MAHSVGVAHLMSGAGKEREKGRAYSLLEHEDANDEGEGDQVSSDPHETVLVWGLWTDGHGRTLS